VTTCSMYLNEHFVVLAERFFTGTDLAATVLDPIKTRGFAFTWRSSTKANTPCESRSSPPKSTGRRGGKAC